MGGAAATARQRPAGVGRVVDAEQLVGVARVRRRRGRVGAVVVVHARPERGAGCVLMVETEGVSYFLTHDVLALVGVVVGIARAGPEVVVVHLDRALHDVRAARLEPDRGDAEPAVVTVARVADLVPTGGRAAVSVPRLPGDDRRVEHGRLRPVARALAQVAL